MWIDIGLENHPMKAAEDMGPIPIIRDAVNEKDRSSEICPH